MSRGNIEKVVFETERCLKQGLIFPALYLVVSLPDMCGKEKWPELAGSKKCAQRYKMWFDSYADCELNPIKYAFPDKTGIRYFGALECYKLRCALLHNGETNIGGDIGIDHFLIQTDSTHFSGCLGSSGDKILAKDGKWETSSYMHIKAIYLVDALLKATQKYLSEGR